jgi:hypothetical protein
MVQAPVSPAALLPLNALSLLSTPPRLSALPYRRHFGTTTRPFALLISKGSHHNCIVSLPFVPTCGTLAINFFKKISKACDGIILACPFLTACLPCYKQNGSGTLQLTSLVFCETGRRKKECKKMFGSRHKNACFLFPFREETDKKKKRRALLATDV